MAESLAQFVASARASSSEALLVALIRNVLSAPDVFVFGELLELTRIQDLAQSAGEGRAWLRVLEIFAYGKYSDYATLQARGELTAAALNERQLRKLKQLSVVALAHDSRVIAYATLLRELDLGSLRELEDLVIDAIYRELLVAKLDHAHAQLEVAHAVGRDVRAQDVPALLAAIEHWAARASALLGTLDSVATRAHESAAQHAQHDTAVAKRLDELRAVVKRSLDDDADATLAQQMHMRDMQHAGMGMAMGMGMGMGDERRGAGKKDAKHAKPGQQGRHLF